MRNLIKAADPDVVEEWKWGIQVWSHDGIVCTGKTYKSVVKLTFTKGASLEDPARLFNSSLEGRVRRAIDIREGGDVDATAFKALFRQAAGLNSSGKNEDGEEGEVLRHAGGTLSPQVEDAGVPTSTRGCQIGGSGRGQEGPATISACERESGPLSMIG